MDSSASHLDAEELLYLAMDAGRAGRADQSLSLLKRAQAMEPANAVVMFLIGAHHAQVGLHDRALQELADATRLSPDFHIARLQLGMLHVLVGHAEQAKEALGPLTGLGDESYFTHFARGLCCLIDGRLDECKAALEQGISLNDENVALNVDMEQILASIDANAAAAARGDLMGTSPATGVEDGNLWMSSYRKGVGTGFQ